jgi:hypothetical protein
VKRKKTTKAIPAPIAAKMTPSPPKIIRTLEAAATFLQGIGGEEDAADFLDENGLTDADVIQNLQKSCSAISKLLRARAAPITENEASRSCRDQYFVYRASSRAVMLLAPVESFRCNSYYTNNKVLGFIRRPGEAFPLMMAFPGWKNCAEAHPKLLDSEIWHDYVLQFAENIDHDFRTDGFDLYHGKKKGSSYASHVEPKLLLWFVCHLYTKKTNKPPNLRRLHVLRRILSGIEVEIVISEEPCRSCQLFKEEIEIVTGVKFTFKVCSNLAVLKAYRDTYGRKRYPAFAIDESELPQMREASEDNDENVQLYPLQPRLPNITVVLNSNISSSNSRDLEVRVSAAKKQSRPGIETPKTQRRKRQYEDTEDEEDYREPQKQLYRPKEHTLRPSPRTRSTSKSETGLVSPTLTPDSSNRDDGWGRVDGERTKRQRTEREKAVRQMIEADRVQRESAEVATSLTRTRNTGKKVQRA